MAGLSVPLDPPRGYSRLAMRVDWVISGRGRYVVIAVWLLAAGVGAAGHARLGAVTAAGQSSFLPKKSQSTSTVKALGKSFSGGDDVPALVVFERRGGLTAADRRAIGEIGDQINRLKLRGSTRALDPFLKSSRPSFLGQAGLESRNGEAAIIPVGFDAGVRGSVTQGVNRIRALLRERAPPGSRPT